MTDVRPPAPGPRRGVHHVDRDVAVVNTGLDVLLTAISTGDGRSTACTATRLAPDQARAIGWALIEAAGYLDAGG